MMRLFVAVWPSPDVIDVLRGIERAEHPRLRWTRPEQWHVTLRFLGTVEVEPVEQALTAMVAPAAVARLGPTLTRLGRGVLAAPVQGLDELAGVVDDATAEHGRRPDRRPFSGHVTLARSRDRVAPSLAGGAVTGEWTVDEVTLVASHLHPHGARYEILRRFPVV
jgi:RNA 2',3'-cyclic 3'-phosphodiesterase